MRQWKRSRFAASILLAGITIFLCWLFVGRSGIFGAKVDWISQHSVIPDYFRQQFYQTGELFPEFAANIGGGQNIYNFSYYGLYSPVILISYLLPFVKMGDYLMTASIVSLAAAVILLYWWLVSRGFAQEISFLTALLFLLAGPMIFQSYNQIMFVNYMPFLCMALWGVDKYFERQTPGLYCISVFLMIMTSFYFSIGGMLVLVLYGIHRYLQIREMCQEKNESPLTVRRFLADGIRFLVPMLTAVLMSGILLAPTAAALSGRSSDKGRIVLKELLVPEIDVLRFVYTPYGIGLTMMVIVVLITGVTYQKRHDRILSLGCIVVLTIPMFAFLLNGGLYIRDKAMIPFLPLLCYLIACYMEKQGKKEVSVWAGVIPCLLGLGLVYLGGSLEEGSQYWKMLMIDGIVMTVCCLIFYITGNFVSYDTKNSERARVMRKKGYLILILPSLVFLFGFGMAYNTDVDREVSREFYVRVTSGQIGQAIEEVLEEEKGFYRMEQAGNESEMAADLNRIWSMRQYVSSLYSSSYHADYQEFRQNVFEVEEPFRNILMQPASDNPVFRRFMGVKYIISEEDVAGYELYKMIGGVKIYRCEAVSPIAYATDRVISESEYRKLGFPYNQTALLSYAVAEKGGKTGKSAEEIQSEIDEKLCREEFVIPEIESGENRIKKTEEGYSVLLEDKIKAKVKITGSGQNLFLQFKVKNHHPTSDVAVWLESTRNKLTSIKHIYYNDNTVFTYAAALQPGQEEVEITFGKGDYEIEDIRCFVGDAGEIFEEAGLYQAEFQADKKETAGKRIVGDIEVQNDGYFITTIPYDKGFEIMVDGKAVAGEKVNTAFLGFNMKKGSHKVEITYHAEGMAAGKVISVIGVAVFVGLCAIFWKRRHE